MGKWNRRYYVPRTKYKQYNYDYEDPPASPPGSYNYESHSSGFANNRVPSWEIDYCHSVKVPWKKVLASKKYIYSYPSVLNWDGSAGNEALENAKKRFWAKINGLPCDNPLPDPDMYISDVDWNPCMDHELMADIDLQVLKQDEAEKAEQLDTINEEVEYAQKQLNQNQYTSDNPWERDHVLGTGNVKEVKGWGGWGDASKLKNDDPWEQSCQKLVGSSNNNGWSNGNDSSGWPQGLDNNTRSSSFVDHQYGKSWNCNEKTVAVRQNGWGSGQAWGQAQRENNSWRGPGNSNAEGTASFENNNLIGSKERGWRDNRNVTWGVRDAEYQGNEAKHWDPNCGPGGRSSRGGGLKRESSVQHTSKYKSSRCFGDSYQYGHQL